MTSRIRKTLNASVAALTLGLAASTLAPSSALAFGLGGLGHMGGFGHTSGVGRVGDFHSGNLAHLSGERGLASAGHGVTAGRMTEAHPTRATTADTTPNAKFGTSASDKAATKETMDKTVTDKSVPDKAASKLATKTDGEAQSVTNHDQLPAQTEKPKPDDIVINLVREIGVVPGHDVVFPNGDHCWIGNDGQVYYVCYDQGMRRAYLLVWGEQPILIPPKAPPPRKPSWISLYDPETDTTTTRTWPADGGPPTTVVEQGNTLANH